MDIGPLEYVVIGYEGDHFTSEILPPSIPFRRATSSEWWISCLSAKPQTVR